MMCGYWLITFSLVYGLVCLLFRVFCVDFGVQLILCFVLPKGSLLTFYQLYPGGAFLIAKGLSKLLKHGRSYLKQPQMNNVFPFYTCPMTSCKIAGERAVSLSTNSGRFFQQLLKLFMIVAMKVAQKLPSDW